MADVLDLESLILDDYPDAPEFRPVPGGRLLVTAQEYKAIENPNNGNRGFEVTFTVDELAGGQDAEGVDVTKAKIFHAFWFTEASIPYAKADIFKIAPDLKNKKVPLPQLVESLMGRQVIVETSLQTHDKKKNKLKYPRHRIEDFETYA